MQTPFRSFIIREGSGVRNAETLVIGRGATIRDTAGGLPELIGARVGEAQLYPSGGDDTQAIRDAIATANQVRLGPGIFRVSGTLNLNGRGVVGSGRDATTVRATHAGIIFNLAGASGVEALTVRGPGGGVVGSLGISAGPASSSVYIRDVVVDGVQTGITIDSGRADVSGVFIGGVGTGLRITGNGATVSNLGVQGAAATALSITGEACSVEGVRIEDCLADGIVIGGKSNALSGARVERSGNSITISGQGVTVDGVTVLACARGVLVNAAQRVVLDAVGVLNTPASLGIAGSSAVTVSAFHSDLRQTSADVPHVVVSASSLVTLVSFLRTNPTAVVLTYEADVASAGGRVVFIQHNLDVAKVNSGGNFAAL